MTGEELLTVCFKIRSYHEQGPIGAVAMVGTPEQTVQFSRLLGALASADRPMKCSTAYGKPAIGWITRPVDACGVFACNTTPASVVECRAPF
jgi:hypothetical protein